MAYLSVPSPGKWISDLFRENIFWHVFDDFVDQHFSKKWISGGSSGQSAKLKSFVYWSSNFEVFTKIRIFHWKFPSKSQFFSRILFSVFTIQKISSKEIWDFGIFFFEHCVLFVQGRFLWLYKTTNFVRRRQTTQIFRPNFEPCSSCVGVDFFRKRRFLEKQDPWKG